LTTKELNGDFEDPLIEEVETGLVKTINIEIAEIGFYKKFLYNITY